MMAVPRLETDRLILRGWGPDDYGIIAAMYGDAEVMKYLGPVQGPTDAWYSLARTIGHWALRGYGSWAVERKSDAQVVGRVGLINPEGWPSLEVGWAVARPYWGMGYATEAAAAAMEYGFLTQNVDRLISLIDADNTASQAVAARLGEAKGPKHTMVLRGESFDVDVWSISREAWRARR